MSKQHGGAQAIALVTLAGVLVLGALGYAVINNALDFDKTTRVQIQWQDFLRLIAPVYGLESQRLSNAELAGC